VSGQFFRWLLGTRNGVYYADGRSGNPRNIGRHSLATTDRQSALEHLQRLDLVKAVEFGLAKEDVLKDQEQSLLSLEDGRQRYLTFVARPPVQGGTVAGTVKRYRAVLDKFIDFAKGIGVCYWQQVKKEVLRRYGSWLDQHDYHDKTQYIELTVLKQIMKWMVSEDLLPASSLIALKLSKPQGTTTYCYTQEQVSAIVATCRQRRELDWLAAVVVALATTGLRIGEMAGLRWSDVNLERGVLHLKDTSRKVRRTKRPEARTTKSHRDRYLPIHEELRPILDYLPRLADGRVFHGPKAGKLKPDTVRNILKREVLPMLTEKFPANGDDPGIMAGRLHSFRHYFCSMSADNDVPEQMLMAWLGHRDSEMIRHYYHLRQDESHKQIAKIPFLSQPDKSMDPTEQGGTKERAGE
jgi:integrase